MTTSADTAVVCDSSQYLPAEVIAAKGIGVVSLYVAIDGDRAERRSPTTTISTAPAPVERRRDHLPALARRLHRRWQAAARPGKEVVSIHISSAISGTFEAANQARQRLIDDDQGGERVHLYDSEMACGGDRALRARRGGGDRSGGGPEEAIAARAKRCATR